MYCTPVTCVLDVLFLSVAEMVILSSKLDLGRTDKAFMCLSSESVHFNATKDTTNALYEADWEILNIHAQAFGVQNGTFSKDGTLF